MGRFKKPLILPHSFLANNKEKKHLPLSPGRNKKIFFKINQSLPNNTGKFKSRFIMFSTWKKPTFTCVCLYIANFIIAFLFGFYSVSGGSNRPFQYMMGIGFGLTLLLLSYFFIPIRFAPAMAIPLGLCGPALPFSHFYMSTSYYTIELGSYMLATSTLETWIKVHHHQNLSSSSDHHEHEPIPVGISDHAKSIATFITVSKTAEKVALVIWYLIAVGTVWFEVHGSMRCDFTSGTCQKVWDVLKSFNALVIGMVTAWTLSCIYFSETMLSLLLTVIVDKDGNKFHHNGFRWTWAMDYMFLTLCLLYCCLQNVRLVKFKETVLLKARAEVVGLQHPAELLPTTEQLNPQGGVV